MTVHAARKARLLVVDDDPLVLGALELLLAERWDVEVASSAAEGREVLERIDVSVIISDQRMPGESGVELLAWARDQRPDAVRILLTGYTDAETVVEAINRAQVWRYIRKPWENTQVVELVERAIEHRRQGLEARRRYEATLHSLVTALEASHPTTAGRSVRVCELVEALADAAELGEVEHALAMRAARVHAIGRVGLDGHHLDRDGPLDDDELAQVRGHVQVGCQVLAEAGFLDALIPLVAAQHERFDGTGYPDGLAGDAIPIGARILAIAIAFAAMTTDRAHRRARSPAEAMEELRRCAGTQFDPGLVTLLCARIGGESALPPGASGKVARARTERVHTQRVDSDPANLTTEVVTLPDSDDDVDR